MCAKITRVYTLTDAVGIGWEVEGVPAKVFCKFNRLDDKGDAHAATSEIETTGNGVGFAELKANSLFAPEEDVTFQILVWPVLLDGQELEEVNATFHIHEGKVVSGLVPKREDPTPVDQPPGLPQPPPGPAPIVPPPVPADQPPKAEPPSPPVPDVSREVIITELLPLLGKFGFAWKSEPVNRFFQVTLVQVPEKEAAIQLHTEFIEGTQTEMASDRFKAGIAYGIAVVPVSEEGLPIGFPMRAEFHVLDGKLHLGSPKAPQIPPPAPPTPTPAAERPEQEQPRKEEKKEMNGTTPSDLQKVLESIGTLGTTLGGKIDTFGNQVAGGLSSLQEGQQKMSETLQSAAGAFTAVSQALGKTTKQLEGAQNVADAITNVHKDVKTLVNRPHASESKTTYWMTVATLCLLPLLAAFIWWRTNHPATSVAFGSVNASAFQTGGTNLPTYPVGMYQPSIVSTGSNCSNFIQVNNFGSGVPANVKVPGVEYYPAFTPAPREKVVTNTQYVPAPVNVLVSNVIVLPPVIQTPPPTPVQLPPPQPAPQASAGPTADWQNPPPPPQGPPMAYELPEPGYWEDGYFIGGSGAYYVVDVGGLFRPCGRYGYDRGWSDVQHHGWNFGFWSNRRTEREWDTPRIHSYDQGQGQRGNSGRGDSQRPSAGNNQRTPAGHQSPAQGGHALGGKH